MSTRIGQSRFFGAMLLLASLAFTQCANGCQNYSAAVSACGSIPSECTGPPGNDMGGACASWHQCAERNRR